MFHSLSFAGQQLRLDKHADGEKVANRIYDVVILETLELRGNTLGVAAAYPIAEALECRPELRVALWSDLFTGRKKEEIPRALLLLFNALQTCSARLVELDLSDNAIGPMGVPGVQQWLSSVDACELKTLRVNNCGMGIAGVTVAKCLEECLEKSTRLGMPLRLQTFIAGRNRLEYKATKALAHAFKRIGTLEEIAMPQNGIKWEGIVELADAVKFNPLLRTLNLGDNTFGVKGAIAMARALSNLTFLEHVDFSDCLCRDAGAMEIVKQLAASKSPLRVLNLAGNDITPKAAFNIMQLTVGISTLEQLILGYNCFGGKFNELQRAANSEFHYVDFGDKDDDQGTLSDASGGGGDDESNEETELGDDEEEGEEGSRGKLQAATTTAEGEEGKKNGEEGASTTESDKKLTAMLASLTT